MSEDHDIYPLLRRISNSSDGASDLDELYKRHGIDPSKGSDELASKIRLDGGNAITNRLWGFGEGVPYREVVEDVAKKLGVVVSDTSSVKKMEEEILGFIAEKYWSRLSEEERDEVIERIKEIDPKVKVDTVKNAMRVGGIGAMIALRDVFGPLIKSILAKAAGAAINAPFAAMFVPGLNVVLGIWVVFDFAGPAYRKTVHTVVELAYRRLSEEFDRDLNPLLHRISNSSGGASDLDELYKRHGIFSPKDPDELARKIRLDGGNSLANYFRGEGVPYREVVEDVAKKLGFVVSGTSSVKKMEEEILDFIIDKYWSELSEEERDEVIEQIKKIDPNIKDDMVRRALSGGAMFALRGPLLKSLLAKAAGVAVGKRLAGFLVPALNVILAAWIVIDLAGPAYRKTVPTVVELAYRRLYHPDN